MSKQPLDVHRLDGHHLLMNLLVREPLGLGSPVCDHEHPESIDVVPSGTDGCNEVPDRVGRINFRVELATSSAKEKTHAFTGGSRSIRVAQIVQFIRPEIVGHEQVECRFI